MTYTTTQKNTDKSNNNDSFSIEALDYKAIGLKCGLEIHQQLDTGKLFCNCPGTIIDEEPDYTVERTLRASKGESGKIDDAVKHELQKNKKLIYYAYDNYTCLVELDEEPPHAINNKALDVVLIISQLFSAQIFDEVHVMRKTVVDGSNTGGFQRTGIVAEDGCIEVEGKSIVIESICLEEDSAKIVEKTTHQSIYNLSRLGIPLIEIATGPDIRLPEEAKAVSAYIGMALRSTGKVKRGLGTIRQDVNVSIVGGERVEVKGAQDLATIPTIINYEIFRQQSLIALKEKYPTININPELVNLTEALSNCESKVIKTGLEKKNGVVYGVKIPDMKGEIGKEISPNRRLGSELSDYAKHASKVKGLFHCDELPKYGITQEDVAIIEKTLECGKNDAFIIIADVESEVKKALTAAIARLNRLPEGVIKEVRDAKQDGSTSFLRPMPGAARMYPETDVPVVPIDKNNLPALPELLTEKKKRYMETFGLSNDLTDKILRGCTFFEELMKEIKTLSPSFIAEAIVSSGKQIQKKFNIEINPTLDDWKVLFAKLEEGAVSKDNVLEILKELHTGKSIAEIAEKFKPMDTSDLEGIVKEVVDANPGKRPNVLMGIIMGKTQGKANGKQVMELLTKLTS